MIETRIPSPAHEEKALSRALDTVGDGTGTDNHLGNYAAAAQIVRIRPPVSKTYRINRLIVHYDDNGAFGATNYGASTGLTIGVKVSKKDANDIDLIDLTNGNPIVSNGDWAKVGDVTIQDWGGGDNMLSATWVFSTPIVLRGYDSESLCVTLNDDFTGLTQHILTAQGVEIGE